MASSRAAPGKQEDAVSRAKPVHPSAEPRRYPDNPVLVRVMRGTEVESQHRGAWVITDVRGKVLDGKGVWSEPIFARSSVKCLQALPLIESGAAERFQFTDAEVALALSSHNAEACHTEVVHGLLARLGLSVADLKCGPQPPTDSEARARLRERGEAPTSLHNNCSGKHAGFLALALHMGVPREAYLDPKSRVQLAVKKAVMGLTEVGSAELCDAIDGCSAPTFRLPLRNLAMAFARVANPESLAPARRAACERILHAAATHPDLIAGKRRICSDLARVSGGRILAKIGGEAVFAMGFRGAGRGIAMKIDDGSVRGLHALIPSLLRHLELVSATEFSALESWAEYRILNWAGLEVGTTEVVL